MQLPNFFLRTFAIGAALFIAVGFRMVVRHPGGWADYPTHNFLVLVIAWIVTALLTGLAATHFQQLRSWGALCLGTFAGGILVMGMMLLVVQYLYAPPASPEFKNTDEMMVFMAAQAADWVKQDRGMELDYSFESIRVIEEELGRVAKDVNGDNPQGGTFGLAAGYGAYIGEVFRRMDGGGSWSKDHGEAGEESYPLARPNASVIFPVIWCWKRLTVGQEENVYHKAVMFTNVPSAGLQG